MKTTTDQLRNSKWAGLLDATPKAKRPQLARHTTGTMNKTESAFARRLDTQLAAKEILAWKFEAVTLRLADGCRYTPDFMVVWLDGSLTFCEVKGGYIHDDSLVKWKLAVELFPWFRWEMWQRGGKGGEFRLIRESGEAAR